VQISAFPKFGLEPDAQSLRTVMARLWAYGCCEPEVFAKVEEVIRLSRMRLTSVFPWPVETKEDQPAMPAASKLPSQARPKSRVLRTLKKNAKVVLARQRMRNGDTHTRLSAAAGNMPAVDLPEVLYPHASNPATIEKPLQLAEETAEDIQTHEQSENEAGSTAVDDGCGQHNAVVNEAADQSLETEGKPDVTTLPTQHHQQQPCGGFQIGMRVIILLRCKFKSGMRLVPGDKGTVIAVPGSDPGEVAEVEADAVRGQSSFVFGPRSGHIVQDSPHVEALLSATRHAALEELQPRRSKRVIACRSLEDDTVDERRVTRDVAEVVRSPAVVGKGAPRSRGSAALLIDPRASSRAPPARGRHPEQRGGVAFVVDASAVSKRTLPARGRQINGGPGRPGQDRTQLRASLIANTNVPVYSSSTSWNVIGYVDAGAEVWQVGSPQVRSKNGSIYSLVPIEPRGWVDLNAFTAQDNGACGSIDAHPIVAPGPGLPQARRARGRGKLAV